MAYKLTTIDNNCNIKTKQSVLCNARGGPTPTCKAVTTLKVIIIFNVLRRCQWCVNFVWSLYAVLALIAAFYSLNFFACHMWAETKKFHI